MIRRPPRSTHCISSAASDVYKRQNNNNKNTAVSFRACADGRGLGEARESLLLVNCLRRDDRGPMAYGATVAVRCGWAKERFLGIHSPTGEVGFWRTLIGAAEKWVLLHPDVLKSSKSGVVGGGGNNSLSLSLIHISEPTRPLYISYAVFCLKNSMKHKNTLQNQR